LSAPLDQVRPEPSTRLLTPTRPLRRTQIRRAFADTTAGPCGGARRVVAVPHEYVVGQARFGRERLLGQAGGGGVPLRAVAKYGELKTFISVDGPILTEQDVRNPAL
jgi:hypothetical protein